MNKVGRTALDEMEKGEFKRVASGYREWIKKGSDKFPPASGRYHLYVAYACPWAHRALIVRSLKGLQKVIGLSVVHPTWQKTRENEEHSGWCFKREITHPNSGRKIAFDDVIQDPINNVTYIRDIYENNNDKIGKYTVPILYDTQTKQIVNNESSEIIQILNSEFNEFAENPNLDLSVPENFKNEMQELDEEIYNNINNGVYRCGFATTQEAYENAFQGLFSTLDKVENILSKKKYLTGDQLTLSDIRLWVTLIRFDEVYVVYFKTNKKRIIDYPNLFRFTKDIYNLKGVPETVNMQHIKHHYYTSHTKLNYYGIVPVGPSFEDLLKE